MSHDTLLQLLELLKTDVINSMQAKGRYATGQTANQITIITDGNKAQLEFPAYMQALETGRRPTTKNALSGNPPMIQRIQQWCRAKGLPDKVAWAIKKSIDKKGYKGTIGILSEPLSDENINLRLNPLLETLVAETTAHILNSLNI